MMSEHLPKSTARLVAALRSHGVAERHPIMRRAKRNDFHDYLSDSAFNIHDLVGHLRRLGLDKLAERAINGEFDATKEESDAWARSEEGQAAFRSLLRRGDTDA